MTNAEINNGKAYISDGKNDFIVDKKTVFVDVEARPPIPATMRCPMWTMPPWPMC